MLRQMDSPDKGKLLVGAGQNAWTSSIMSDTLGVSNVNQAPVTTSRRRVFRGRFKFNGGREITTSNSTNGETDSADGGSLGYGDPSQPRRVIHHSDVCKIAGDDEQFRKLQHRIRQMKCTSTPVLRTVLHRLLEERLDDMDEAERRQSEIVESSSGEQDQGMDGREAHEANNDTEPITISTRQVETEKSIEYPEKSVSPTSVAALFDAATSDLVKIVEETSSILSLGENNTNPATTTFIAEEVEEVY